MKNAYKAKYSICAIIVLIIALCLSACGNTSETQTAPSKTAGATSAVDPGASEAKVKALVVYFSHAGENYSVGVIE